MSVKRVDTAGAQALMSEGYVFLDVRSVGEYEAGHPEGAYNVPIMHREMGQMTPNADFLSVVQANFEPDAKLVVSCKMGGRSARAAAVLEANGFVHLADMSPGWSGSRDGTPGWESRELPTGEGAPEGRAYEALLAKSQS